MVAKKNDTNEQRVLANKEASDDESIERMVRQLEREFDKEFGCFGQTKDIRPATSAAVIADAAAIAAEVPAKKGAGRWGGA